jgi:hypothetical protein
MASAFEIPAKMFGKTRSLGEADLFQFKSVAPLKIISLRA